MHNVRRLTLRLPQNVIAKLSADPAPLVNFSAFAQVITESSIASGHRAPRTRGNRATSARTVDLPAFLVPHFHRCAKAAGFGSVGVFISEAITRHYFGGAHAA